MSIFEQFKKTAESNPDNSFIHIPPQATSSYGGMLVEYSYGEALESVMELARHYGNAGYGKGHRVAVVFDNRAEFFLHFQALNKLGISVVPVNSSFQASEMAYVIQHSDACLVVSLPLHRDNVNKALETMSEPPALLDSDSMDAIPQAKTSCLEDEISSDTEAAVLYTSGTTGEPKGCMLSNDYFICLGQWYCDITGYCSLEYGKERMLTPLPLVHMNALCTMMAMIMSAGCVIQLDRFHASSWWATVRESRATCLHYLGVIPAILLNLPETDEDNVGEQVKFGFGAGVDPKHYERFEERFGFHLVEGWAMTESGTHVSITTHEEPRHIGTRCIGKPLNEIEYRLVDESGNDVNEHEPGELLIRAAGDDPRKGFFSGYYKNEQATRECWEGGYFHTGDIVRTSEDGSFHFVDRRKNIIRRSGENIAAVEVENVLFQSDDVANCAVTPVYDEMRGEEVAACVVLSEESEAGEELAKKIFSFCNEKLVYYKTPAYFLFLNELPMTSSQKIQRGEIKKLAAELVEKGACVDLRTLKKPAAKSSN